MALKIEDLLDDVRKVRNDLVAQSNPHFQDLTNIIYKWETKIVQDTPAYKQQKAMEEKEKELEADRQAQALAEQQTAMATETNPSEETDAEPDFPSESE